jgi:hypothetical protein
MENNLRCSFSRSNGRAILIVLYPRVSHAVYLDPTRNYEKKDVTHIMNILDEALHGFSLKGGHMKIRKTRNKRPGFSHKTNFCCIHVPKASDNDGFYLIHLMTKFRLDHQKLHMTARNDDHIREWVETLGEADYKVRDDFFRIQGDIATIIIKEVVDEKGMFHHGPISRDDIRTRVGMQRQELMPFTKLGDILPDLDGWNF